MKDHVLVVGSLPAKSLAALSKAGYEVKTAHCAGDSWKGIVDGSPACVVAVLPLADVDSVAFLNRARGLNARAGMVVVAGNPAEIEDHVEGLGVYSVSALDIQPVDLVDKVFSACELASMTVEAQQRLEETIDGEVTKMRRMRHSVGCDTKIYSPEELKSMLGRA
jgi:DNA-binding NtrC family response regulator